MKYALQLVLNFMGFPTCETVDQPEFWSTPDKTHHQD
jgi:hypothetical protein